MSIGTISHIFVPNDSERLFTYNIVMSESKTILHMDGDAFFVGVEVAKNPKLRGLPVVTGQERGIVSALSYEAKALGVTRGLPIFQLKKLFPKVIILPGDYASYIRYSQSMFDIVRRYADDVEEYSIDECFADLTGCDRPLKMSYLQIAQRIKNEIKGELDLSVSIGLAPTKVLSKIASKWIKPNGLTVITHSGIENFLKDVPVGKVWGIGRNTSEFLIKREIKTALDFYLKDLDWVKENLAKPYEIIWYELHGQMVNKVDPKPKLKYSSIQKTRSFHPASKDEIFLFSQLSKHIEDACAKARHFNLLTKKVSIFLKSRGFEYFTYSFDLTNPTNAPEIIISLSKKYFNKIYNKQILYRTAGVRLYELISNEIQQKDLFGNNIRLDKFELIHRHIDNMERKYGRRVVYLASTHNAIKYKDEKLEGTDAEDLDRDLLFL